MDAGGRRDEPVRLRLKDQQEAPAPGPGLAARGRGSWASRWERGQGGTSPDGSAGLGAGGEVVSYLVAGMLAYGGIGWLIGRAVHLGLLFPIGMAVGLAIALGWVVYRYGRAGGGREQ